jgi:hypothetical protein
MTESFDWRSLVVEPIQEMLTKITTFIPSLVGALLVLVIGWVIAKAIRGLVSKVLGVVRFETMVEKAGVAAILKKGNIRTTTTQLLSGLAYWLVMIMALVAVVNALGMNFASQLLENLVAYIPNVILALFVLVLGMFLGTIVSGVVRTAALNADLPNPGVLSRVSQWAIVVFASIVALRQLGIAPLLVVTTFNIFFGGICLALALAFGLGGRDAAAKYLEKVISNSKRK